MMDIDSDSSSNSDWEECPEEEMLKVLCTFCTSLFKSADEVWAHCQQVHGVHLSAVARQHKLDCFGHIKMVNYLRRHKCSVEDFQKFEGDAWENEEYMFPVIEDDLLLQYDIESSTEMDAASSTERTETDCNGQSGDAESLKQQLTEANARAKTAETQIELLVQELDKMRGIVKEVLSGDVETRPTPAAEEDDPYFESYSHFSIHQSMLQDRVRTESYRDAINSNRSVFEGKTVLDVGCGTGILGMFAARGGGAKQVIGVDKSEIIYQAMDIVRENKLEDKITLIRGCMEDVTIPAEKVDIVISEWMGYCLLFESMLDSVIYARDRFLSEGGLMLPNRTSMSIVGVDDLDLHQSNLDYWDDVYSFRMSCMKAAVVQEALVQLVNKEKIATSHCMIRDLDLCTCSVKDLEFMSDIKLTAERSCFLTALVVYFDVHFTELPHKVFFSTSPSAEPTHWKQTVFMLESGIKLAEGEKISGSFTLHKNRKNPRGLKITIKLRDRKMIYYMN